MHKNTNFAQNAAKNYQFDNSIYSGGGGDFYGEPGGAVELKTTNPHAENMQEFNNTRLFKRLAEKHHPKPFWKQYRGIYRAVLGTSFLFNILSALTASAVVFLFVQGLTGSMTASVVITVIMLSVLEYMKRETSGKLFHEHLQFKKWNYGLFFAVVILSAISTTASYFGASQVVESLTPPPALADVAEQTAGIESQIAGIDQQIAAAQRNTWQGRLTPRSQRTVERLTESRAALTDELMRTRERTDMQNDEMQSEHMNETMANAGTFAMFTLICELLLIACLYFMQFYDFRSFAEYALANKSAETSTRSNGFRTMANGAYGANGAMNGASNGANGQPQRNQIGFRYANRYEKGNETGETQHVTQSVTEPNGADDMQQRRCQHCDTPYIYGHTRQKFCSESCRISAWRKRTGRDPYVM